MSGSPHRGRDQHRYWLVTQESNLFPWVDTHRECRACTGEFAAWRETRENEARKFIDMMQLSGFETHYPFELSDGMQKPASIIRTSIYDPDIILMDEPFGPLDAQC